MPIAADRLAGALASLWLSLAPVAAVAADCPVPGDTGVRAEYADGGVVDYRLLPDGQVEVFEPAAGGAGEGLVFTSLYGVYDLTVAARDADGGTDPDRTLRYGYATDDHPLARPESGAVWVGTAVTHWPDGSETAETAAYVFGREGERQLSGCTYRTIPVKVTFMDDRGWVAQDLLYFIDFGLSVATGRQHVTDRAPRWRALAGLVPITP
ncbi:hypothetical protein LX70_00062 [Defluviimonas denitrificans]|uniref:YD repeat-containing protein n=1 Tax=Albidovulum denitrificans TaxID=404881 RepID=A0A2S8SBP5_9RHOB|nr:hypothetical protein [Defluviimonas denitrificans]PQV58255.1 hypothetical protein LX70_00062 [Defluviimonas denitrificans]